MNERIRVLYVDDEVNNLNAFKAHFRPLEEYEIFTCQSGDEALKIINDTLIHVAVVDQRMPQMTGIEFIEEAEKRKLDPIKIVVTAHRDTGKIEEAYEQGKIFAYHEKPFDTDLKVLKDSIENAYQRYLSQKA